MKKPRTKRRAHEDHRVTCAVIAKLRIVEGLLCLVLLLTTQVKKERSLYHAEKSLAISRCYSARGYALLVVTPKEKLLFDLP